MWGIGFRSYSVSSRTEFCWLRFTWTVPWRANCTRVVMAWTNLVKTRSIGLATDFNLPCDEQKEISLHARTETPWSLLLVQHTDTSDELDNALTWRSLNPLSSRLYQYRNWWVAKLTGFLYLNLTALSQSWNLLVPRTKFPPTAFCSLCTHSLIHKVFSESVEGKGNQNWLILILWLILWCIPSY